MKFCPLRSTDEKEVECSKDCAFFADNKQCAVKNIGNMSINSLEESINKNLLDISNEIFELQRCR